MIADRRTKIVATIGPSLSRKELLQRAIESGMNVARLNFSHGDHPTHLKTIQDLRSLSSELKAPVTVLQDLQGPKIRVGRFRGGCISLKEGQVVKMSSEYPQGEDGKIPIDLDGFAGIVKPGARVLLDDGLLEMRVQSIEGKEVELQVVFGGELKDRKGVNLPGLPLPIDCLTKKDLDDLEFGLDQGVDYVALSFVRRGSDIRKLRELINASHPGTRIVAKIEMLEAIEHLDEIVELSDAVMVARGDLAVEVGHAQLPLLQKRIIGLCNRLGRPVITATQMLDSMVENPRPTRAEVTDVANAVMDGSDALMLSAETASGKYPMECLQTMQQIILQVEQEEELFHRKWDEGSTETPAVIAASASIGAKRLEASAIVCLTTSGKTASLISRWRPKAKIIAMTDLESTLNKLELVWGIQTFPIRPYRSTDEAMAQIEELLLMYGLVETGDRVVLTMGVPVTSKAKTNSMRVYQISGDRAAVSSSEKPLRCR